MLSLFSEKYMAARPASLDFESRDCAVRAAMCALDCPYEVAHMALETFGRVRRRGTWPKSFDAWTGRFAPYGWTYGTVAAFARKHPDGEFVLFVRGHYIALVNGVVHNWKRGRSGGSKARARVVRAWKVINHPTEA